MKKKTIVTGCNRKQLRSIVFKLLKENKNLKEQGIKTTNEWAMVHEKNKSLKKDIEQLISNQVRYVAEIHDKDELIRKQKALIDDQDEQIAFLSMPIWRRIFAKNESMGKVCRR